jgi:hypothetical protein
MIMEGKCVDKCDNIKSRSKCRETEYCTWLFSRRVGDDGRCVNKREDNYSCSDIKRNSDCFDGANIDILFNKCEYYKDKCRERCELYLDKSGCEKEGDGDCLWKGTCTLKVYYK